MRATGPFPAALRCLTYWLWFGSLALLTGCATDGSSSTGPQGSSGSVTWEIVDMGQLASSNGQRLRWSYVIVLRETAGSAVQFERLERGSRVEGMELTSGGISARSFSQTLPARGELRVPTVDSWGWSAQAGNPFGGTASLQPIAVEYRFFGRTGQESVTIPVRIRLHRGVGKVVRPVLSTTAALPPSKMMTTGDLAGLAGQWRGALRADGDVFDVPIECTFEPDGTVRIAMNDPVTDRFRAAVSVRDGGLAYAGNRDTGSFTLHEREKDRILAGYVTGPREGPQAPVGYTIRLQWQGP